MADGQQEHRREHPVANRQRCGHSQIFSDHKRRARHRLADDCQHRFVVDLVCKHAGSGESSQQEAGEEQRAQTQVDQQFVVVFKRERREVHVEHQRQDAYHHQHDEHRLADRFEKPIAGDSEDDHCGGYSRCPGAWSPTGDSYCTLWETLKNRMVCRERSRSSHIRRSATLRPKATLERVLARVRIGPWR